VPIAAKLEKLPEELGLKRTILGIGKKDDPKDWKFDKDFETAVLLYKNYNVIDFLPFAVDKLTNKDADAIATEFDQQVPYYARPGYRPKLKIKKPE
jgi:hypothetical protein